MKEVSKMDIRQELIRTKTEMGGLEAINHTFQVFIMFDSS